ncbi:universal stress protein [Steroidobacter agaridevorans]|uniref:universal stress protein n=1 Tax=Steroidobacter agaridevorans TaxID=2695856 RepID=UPI00137A9912|nr:universal stress protein [Steroidobacter agaridevorans]
MTKLSLISKAKPVAIKAHVSAAPGSTPVRVMCATDLWGESEHALQKALWLAKETDVELLLLHVVDAETPPRLTGRMAEHARRALQWRVRRWPELKPRPAISVRIGDPHRTISRIARQWRADLVIMGSARPRPMDRFLATTAERVATEARCAVLVVNDSKPETDCVIVQADRWPAFSGLFRRSAASMLASSRTTNVFITPHRGPAASTAYPVATCGRIMDDTTLSPRAKT